MKSTNLCSAKSVTKTPTGPDELGGPAEIKKTNSGLCVREMQGTSLSAYRLRRRLSAVMAGFPEEQAIVVYSWEDEERCRCYLNRESNALFPYVICVISSGG